MIRHFFKLVWNRRRANGLILVELLCSFLVLCGVLVTAVYNLDMWRRPVGFRYADVWNLSIDAGTYSTMTEEAQRAAHDRAAQLALELRRLPEIERISPYGYNSPFTRSTSAYGTRLHGRSTHVEITETDAELMGILGLELVAGRWLEPGDGDLNWVPVVITRNYAELLYGSEDPIGQDLVAYNADGTAQEPDPARGEKRVVGVVADMRRRGPCEGAPLAEFQAVPSTLRDLEWQALPTAFLIKVRPGTTAAFEETLMRLGHGVAPDWQFEVATLDDGRRDLLRETWLPLLIGGVVAGFLVIMVGLGLVGVLWQTVTRRTRELGLRRALGATATAVRWQVLGELLVLTTLAIVVGGLIFLQLPMLNLFSQTGLRVRLIALAVGVVVLYPYVILCGLYPSWLATRVHPVQALQHE